MCGTLQLAARALDLKLLFERACALASVVVEVCMTCGSTELKAALAVENLSSMAIFLICRCSMERPDARESNL